MAVLTPACELPVAPTTTWCGDLLRRGREVTRRGRASSSRAGRARQLPLVASCRNPLLQALDGDSTFLLSSRAMPCAEGKNDAAAAARGEGGIDERRRRRGIRHGRNERGSTARPRGEGYARRDAGGIRVRRKERSSWQETGRWLRAGRAGEVSTTAAATGRRQGVKGGAPLIQSSMSRREGAAKK